MKTLLRYGCPVVLAAGLVLGAGPMTVAAQDRERAELNERITRLERCVHEMAEHQKKAMEHIAAGMQRPAAGLMTAPCPTGPLLSKPGMPPMPAKCPLKPCPYFWMALLGLAATINILLAVWIFTDIRKRGEGHGIFVALALLAGVPTAIIYALVRIGDKKT